MNLSGLSGVLNFEKTRHNSGFNLLNSFHLNGHIVGFRPQTQKLELRTKQIVQKQNRYLYTMTFKAW